MRRNYPEHGYTDKEIKHIKEIKKKVTERGGKDRKVHVYRPGALGGEERIMGRGAQ